MRYIVALACLVAIASAAANRTIRGVDAPHYYQCGQSYSDDQLGTCSDTICSAGCAITSVTMYMGYRGYGGDPGDLNAWLRDNGGYASGCLIYWAKPDDLGYTAFQGMETPDYGTVCSGLDNGHGIVCNVNNGGHYVLATGCDGNGNYYVNDPAGRRDSFGHDEVVVFVVYH